MENNNPLKLIENQIVQVESYLWEREFETPFRLKRLVGEKWELLSWKKMGSRFRLCFTRIASFELSGGVPDLDVVLADASDEIKLSVGTNLENFMMKFFEIDQNQEKQTKEIEYFNNYLQSLRKKIDQSDKEIRRVEGFTSA